MQVAGTFNVKFEPQTEDSIDAGRMIIHKDYVGGLSGTGDGQMLSKRTSHENSAAYVAVETFSGSVDGVTGAFSLYHLGVMNKGDDSLTVAVVPDSGTGDLSGISGNLTINIEGGKHHYVFDYMI